MCRVPAIAVVYLFLVSFTAVLHGQSTNASLTGRVTDPTKAMIVDARVSAISTGTNLRYETMTNSSGEYYLANLPPNLYRIEVEKNGFTKLIKPDVVLRGEFFNILNHPNFGNPVNDLTSSFFINRI